FVNPVQLAPTFDGTKLYVAEEGTLGMNDGAIHLVDPASKTALGSVPANTPHAIAADMDNVYWVEFAATTGAVMKASADLSGAATPIAMNQAFPSSIAVDANA